MAAWAAIVAAVLKAWNGLVRLIGWAREIGIYVKGWIDADRAQKKAERKEAEDARRARERMEGKTDAEIDDILRGDDPS